MDNKVTWSYMPQTCCKYCGMVFIPAYRGQFMSCRCSDPVMVDYTPEYTRYVGDATKLDVNEDVQIPVLITIALEERQKPLRQVAILSGEKIGWYEYAEHFRSKIENKGQQTNTSKDETNL